ncbi:MAG: 2-oxoglutarate dehydrogenase E1 component [Chloroflexota bacterium]
MDLWHEFHGPNAAYVLELYERYRNDPNAVDERTRALFASWTPPAAPRPDGAGEVVTPDITKVVGAVNLAQSIREYGHLAAQLDPLGSEPPGDPSLLPETHGITEDDLHNLPASLVGGPVAARTNTAYEAIAQLREIYSSTIGYDFDHLRIPEEREWLRDAVESGDYRPELDDEFCRALLDRLTQVETFELFLQRSFPTKYRFSIEGLDMMVPLLDEVIANAAENDVSNLILGMAHRGRLNILAHIMQKPYEMILAEFKDPLRIQELQQAIGWTQGDVKYHMGTRRAYETDNMRSLCVTVPPNPSHLELINPVVEGMARAAGTLANRGGEPVFNPDLTLPILIHGDAAFPGQGIVAETLNLSQLAGYWTGGTIHVIANNQLGFTTGPNEGRSTLYASDLAKGFKIPIVHVNADDPVACIEVARIAYAYLARFGKDFLIDLIGYRRYGHNELDEPGFTQPLLYQRIRQHPTVRKLWADELIANGVVTEDEANAMIEHYNRTLQSILDSLEDRVEELAEPLPEPPPPGEARRAETGVSAERLRAINDALRQFPKGFTFFSSRLENTLRARRDALESETPAIDWATAEELAFATILEDGIPIRLTGQDTERGTFSQRHAVLHDAKTGEEFIPLQALPQAKAAFEIRNSPLSEIATLGFEYGYNVQEPGRLVIWEAQYGDFINGAQSIIDEFIFSAREKWGQTPSLVLLLPHGWEGAGPDHSSGRLERFLQLAAKTNARIANPTTAAQYFHLLRRQAELLNTDPLPLVVMTPKSLLRHPAVASSLDDLANGRWQPVIDDAGVEADQVRRLVLCSGKFYYDLATSEYREQHPEVALVRVEQLYPFPVDELREAIGRYTALDEIVWAQEEPKNMGAWEYMSWRLERLIENRLPVNYVGRRRSSSPAEGSLSAHKANQAMIVEYAFRWKFER